jgi:predicted patatin/cPLA2 family phospholipase
MGGGMRSAYSAGFLSALGGNLQLMPDIILGTSANAGNALYFAAGQFRSARRVWCDLIATPRFISLWRIWKVLDIDYLVDSIVKTQEPLDAAALAASPLEWYVPLTDVDTGATRYVGKEDRADPLELLRAATAVPFFFGKFISLMGHRFMDGEIGSGLEDHARFCIEKGASRIVIVNDGRIDHGLRRFIKRFYAAFEPEHIRTSILRELAEREHVCFTGPAGVEVLCIFPETLPAAFFTIDKQALAATFERGRDKAIAIEQELRRLLS